MKVKQMMKACLQTMRTGDAAKALGVSVQTLRQWAEAGEVPCRTVCLRKRKTYIFSVAELQKWLGTPNRIPHEKHSNG